ncbi:hypothetical protein FNQ90_14135 [Streptomyces alkaliphilus]|uniref:Cell envelope biogenesis protein TolA n=1 Tax=Streptomyces alkaliphilus TaxID=1472722 RepID=A0A7W3TE75_9ACTN|nr:hypothetical protein [Streptomyces alkaliphilus]MBB0245211.1 hypothetical protein [Streptomyces alkaliphilus]
MTSPRFTPAEKAARIATVCGYLGGVGDRDRHLSRMDAINERGRRRAAEEAAAWQIEHREATALLAAARVAERSASRENRKDARAAVKEAEARVKCLERSRPRG